MPDPDLFDNYQKSCQSTTFVAIKKHKHSRLRMPKSNTELTNTFQTRSRAAGTAGLYIVT